MFKYIKNILGLRTAFTKEEFYRLRELFEEDQKHPNPWTVGSSPERQALEYKFCEFFGDSNTQAIVKVDGHCYSLDFYHFRVQDICVLGKEIRVCELLI